MNKEERIKTRITFVVKTSIRLVIWCSLIFTLSLCFVYDNRDGVNKMNHYANNDELAVKESPKPESSYLISRLLEVLVNRFIEVGGSFLFQELLRFFLATLIVVLLCVSLTFAIQIVFGFTKNIDYISMMVANILIFIGIAIGIIKISNKEEIKIESYGSLQTNLLKITKLLYSSKTQKDVFIPIVGDWYEECYETLEDKEMTVIEKTQKLHILDLRRGFDFLNAMWQKSPLGDLLEYVRKFAS